MHHEFNKNIKMVFYVDYFKSLYNVKTNSN